MLSDAEVARLEARGKWLGLSRRMLLERFAAALKRDGIAPTPNSVKMRLDRVLNPRMRRPTSDETLLALATALDWSVLELRRRWMMPRRNWRRGEERAVNLRRQI